MSEINQQPSDGMSKHALERELIARTHKDATFKQKLLSNPKATVKEILGVEFPEYYEVKVFEQPTNSLYLVIPQNIESNSANAELSEEELEAVAGGCSFKVLWTGLCVD
ncbi:NHLP leader peptide family RiPP precursor [uncultured Nostoc sp.]|uniref:NHLP leader peptide family RiPP precursor n=1 Tax=uncultured Nostoc sp. TaxID=340711 RepID=UPI0035CA6731